MLVGELEGEVSTSRLTFEAFKEVEQFDFITVKNPKEGQEWILAQVDEVVKQQDGKTEAEAQIIGYREDGMLKQPRHVVDPDAMVYRADESVIADTLGLTQDGLYLGRLDTNPDISIFLNPEDLYKHIAVLAKTGAGKSYFTSVMVEELLEADYPVIVVDPHGEYRSLGTENEISGEDRETYGIEPKRYEVEEFTTSTDVNPDAEPLSFSSEGIEAKEIEQMVPTNLTNSQLEVLYNALKDLEKRDSYDIEDVVDRAMEQDSKAKWNLVNVLEIVKDSNLFSEEPTPLDELVEGGKASIINLKGEDPEMQEMLVYMLAKELFEKRKRGELQPFIMVLEEAHNFVPERNFGKAVCSDILRTVASEGRKFGLGLGVVSQRPARVDKNILSQCNTQFILRVTNPNDLKAISRSFEGVNSEVKDYITSLPPGVGLLLGKEYPVMTDVRTRRSVHGGEAKELSEEEEDEEGPEEPEEQEGEREGLEDVHDDGVQEADPRERDAEEAGEEGAEEAGEEDVSVSEQEATPEVPSRKRGERIECLIPVLSFGKLEEELGEVEKAYYPVYLVKTSEGRAAIDGNDAEVKGMETDPGGAAADALELLKRKERSRGEMVEALDISLGQLESIQDELEREGLADEEDGTVSYTGFPAFVRGREEKVPEEESTVLEAEITKEEAVERAVEELGGEEKSVELVYYPYYTAGERVFDALKGEEV